MSRVSLIEQLYAPKRKSALEFNYDNLWAPPIRFFLSQQDINELYRIATSLKYNDNIEKKYELIDAVMRPRGFKRGNCGTNRVVYNFLEDTSFCMKIALDRVGINDSPREYKNQEFFKPFCCKIFEVDPTGVIACVERVNPISSLEEFVSIADDVFNMMVTKIIGKYVVDDLGTEKFMNYGIRYNSNGVAFGPVVLDYPYAYELDGAKLRCGKPIQIGNKEFACGGEIDYDSGLNNLVCCKCGRHYSARELAKDDSNVLKFYSDDGQCRMRARIVRKDGTIIKDSGRSSKVYMTKEEYQEGTKLFEVENFEPRRVKETIKNKYIPMKKLREQYYTELQVKAYEEMQKTNSEPFNPVIKPEFGPRPAKTINKKTTNNTVANSVTDLVDPGYEFPRVRHARRAENSGQSTEDIVNKPNIEEETLVIKKAKIENASLMPDGSIGLYLTEVEYESNNNESNELNNAIIDALHEVINEDTHYEYPGDNDDNHSVNDVDVSEIDNNEKYDITNEVECSDDVSINKINMNTEIVREVIQSASDAIEEMEADVFPEILNKTIVVGTTLSEDIDYSNYEPPEENNDNNYDSEEDDEYSDYYEENRKDKKRSKKQQNTKNRMYYADDMSDY